MMKTKLYVPDIECESCVKLLDKKFKGVGGIHEFTVNSDSVDIGYDENMLKAEDLVTAVEDLGFRASVRPFERKSFSERWRDFRENRHKYEMPIKASRFAIAAFLVIVFLQALAYIGFLKAIPNFIGLYGWWLLYLDLSVAALGASIWYLASHKGTVTCMTGMMIGMTVGMQTGMMLGAVMGGVNGFFIGAVIGMTLAVIAGTITGAVCGIMGAVQGMMTGIMAGTMGAMITVMMFSDHILAFMPYYMAINIVVLAGLVYLFFEEVVEGKKAVKKQPIGLPTFLSVCIILTTALSAIMIYGPKSPLFG